MQVFEAHITAGFQHHHARALFRRDIGSHGRVIANDEVFTAGLDTARTRDGDVACASCNDHAAIRVFGNHRNAG